MVKGKREAEEIAGGVRKWEKSSGFEKK